AGGKVVSVGYEWSDGRRAQVLPYERVLVSERGLFRVEFQRAAYNPPYEALRLPLRPGKSWDIDATTGGVKFGGTSTAVGVERVKVPAGEYEAFRVDTAGTGGKPQRDSHWYAPGGGLVQHEVDREVNL